MRNTRPGNHPANIIDITQASVPRSDGTMLIRCSKCGCSIAGSTIPISGVICHKCATGEPRPKEVPLVGGIPRPDLMTQDEKDALLQEIFDEETFEAGSLEDRGNPLSLRTLVAGTFRALGFRKKVGTEVNQAAVEYDTTEQNTSKEIAKSKKRKPIFSGRE